MAPSFRAFIPVPSIHGTNGRKPQHMDRIQDVAHLALEHATGNGIESSLGFVTGLDALQENCAGTPRRTPGPAGRY
jgi:hypothetical protein